MKAQNYQTEVAPDKAGGMFRVKSKAKVYGEPFVDWYQAATAEAALELAKEDAHRYGLPADTQFTCVEVDSLTLLPKGGAS
jgi:hypothetical protein